jgi:hypothetical protein
MCVVSARLSCIILRIWSLALCPNEVLGGGCGRFAAVLLFILLKYTAYICKLCNGSIRIVEKRDTNDLEKVNIPITFI